MSNHVLDQVISTSSTSTSNTYHLYLHGEISYDENRTKILLNEFRAVSAHANGNDRIVLHINSTGGSVYTALEIIQALRVTQAKLSIMVSGTTMSAASFIMMSLMNKATSITVSSASAIMVHSPTVQHHGTPDELEGYSQFFSLQRKHFSKPYKAILTKKEYRKAFKQEKNVYLMGEELYRRLKEVYPDKDITLVE